MTDTLDAPTVEPPGLEGRRRPGDAVFKGFSTAAGILILVTLFGVALFLLTEAFPSFTGDQAELGNKPFIEYVGPLVFGTIYIAALALALATPLAVAVALYITHYSPKRLAVTLGYFVDLLAAIPSVVYGLWGVLVLAPILQKSVFPLLEDHLGFLPMFKGPVSTGRTVMTVGVVLAVMILPIITAISREVFLQTPRLHEEASLALGATKWEMIRQAVLPYGRSGVISGAMLGLGRALGETMAVAIVLSPNPDLITFNQISNENSNTIAANIALRFPDSSGLEVNRLIATGLVLFAITFVVNYIARWVAGRGFSGAAG